MHAEKLIEQWLQDNQPTKCPTLVADGVRFWSPCSQPKLGAARPLQVISFKSGVGALFANPGRDRHNKKRMEEFRARKALALAMAEQGLSQRAIAEKMGIPRRTVREYLKGDK
jgi:DNA-binding NarL/FixJ family response regulator